MRCYPVLSGIRFNDCLFSEPAPIGAWHPPGCAGIVAILARNAHWSPKPVQPLYFGEFGNDSRTPVLPPNMRRQDLLVSVLPLPYSTSSQRQALCHELIAAHNPAWQSAGSAVPAAELARKVNELEARQQEQSQQILSLLAQLGKLFEPLPVGPRRPIGFMPQTATESGS